MSLRKQVFEAGSRGDWGFFREHYHKLSIQDLVWINTKWDDVLPYQKSHSLGAMHTMFESIYSNLFISRMAFSTRWGRGSPTTPTRCTSS